MNVDHFVETCPKCLQKEIAFLILVLRYIKYGCNILWGIFISSFSYLFPKSKTKWIFGAWDGAAYSDNSKYLYEYIIKTKKSIEAIWITKNNNVLKQLQRLGYKCYSCYSWKGVYSALTAKVAFITSDETRDISPFVNRKKTIVVQLWHGLGPKLQNWKIFNGKLSNSGCRLKRHSEYYWMATSKKYIDVFHSLLSVPEQNFCITGYPRNDALYCKQVNKELESLRRNNPDCKFVIYMPTHRNFGKENLDISAFKMVDRYLRDNKIIMVYKPHIHELKNVLGAEKEFTNIILAKDVAVWGDPYSYIYYFDLLISDYSSIAYDFLCVNKPIVLYAFDIDHYRNQDAGLADFYEKIPLGPICLTWEETLKTVNEQLAIDSWKDKREKCREYFHQYNDGKNCDRVYNMVMTLLKNK